MDLREVARDWLVKDVGGGYPDITASIVRVDDAQHKVVLLGGVILQQGCCCQERKHLFNGPEPKSVGRPCLAHQCPTRSHAGQNH